MLLLALDLLLVAVAAWCAHRAVRLDRELRCLLPLLVERRWRTERDRVRRALALDFLFDPWDRLPLGPARWQRHLHGERGAILVDQFWLSVGVACLALASLGVLTAVLGQAA